MKLAQSRSGLEMGNRESSSTVRSLLFVSLFYHRYSIASVDYSLSYCFLSFLQMLYSVQNYFFVRINGCHYTCSWIAVDFLSHEKLSQFTWQTLSSLIWYSCGGPVRKASEPIQRGKTKSYNLKIEHHQSHHWTPFPQVKSLFIFDSRGIACQ